MKTILSSRIHHYLAIVSIFLIMVALIAGMIGCGPALYSLTISSTAGGSVTTPGEGQLYYPMLEVVSLVATPYCGYVFDNWTGDTGTIDDVNAAATNITINGDYSITANFKPLPLDHFKCYRADWVEVPPPTFPVEVQLEDQFGTFNATVGGVGWFGNPAEKVHGAVTTPIIDQDNHFTLYNIELWEEEERWKVQSWQVTVNNQFGNNQELTVTGPIALAVPTQKEGHEEPGCLDHFLIYEAYGPSVEVVVELNDQFTEESVMVYEPVLFANPVQKTHDWVVTEVENPEEHLVFYSIEGEPFSTEVQIANQFGLQTLALKNPARLAVPSEMIAWEQPLDHFKGYLADWAEVQPPAFPVEVQLEDQFHEFDAITANVTNPILFTNPVKKWYGEEFTPMWNYSNHLTFYLLDYDEDPQEWEVTVNNQFGNNQELTVAGPFWLAVPTQKGTLDPPVDLDHFLVYLVTEYNNEPVEVVVDLWDQFTSHNEDVSVYAPILFANPVQKTIVDSGEATEIKEDEHLLFYWISGGYFVEEGLPIANQFGPQILHVTEEADPILGVPSEKTGWDGPWPYIPVGPK